MASLNAAKRVQRGRAAPLGPDSKDLGNTVFGASPA